MSSIHNQNVLSESIVEQNNRESSVVRSSKVWLEKSPLNSEIKSINSRALSKVSKRSDNRGIRSVSSIINNKTSHDAEANKKEDEYVRIDEYEVEQMPSVNRQLHKPRKNSSRKLSVISQRSRQSRSRSNTAHNDYGQFSRNKPSQINPQESKFTSKISIPVARVPLFPTSKLKMNKEAQQSLSYLEDNKSKDLISGPDTMPQKHSFHLNQSKSIDAYQLSPKMSFKEALKTNFEGIDARQQQAKLFAKDQYFRNIVKSPKSSYRTQKRSNYQATASKRSQESQLKFQSKLRSHFYQSQGINDVQHWKDQQIQEMHQKLRLLQQQKRAMQTQLAIRENQIKSLKGSAFHGSQNSVKFGHNSNNSNFYNKEKQGSSLKSSFFPKRGQSEFEKEVQVHYRHSLEKIKGSNFRKNLIRNKCLALNSEQVQIGCLSRPLLEKDGTLNLTLFVTFSHHEVSQCSIELIHDGFIEASVIPQTLTHLQPRKQRKLQARLRFLSIPFNIPQIAIIYKIEQDYGSKHIQATLPIAFNKFVQILPFHNTFQNEADPAHLKTNQFKYNFKNIPLERLPSYMTGWSVISSNLRNNQLVLGARCCFIDNKFNIMISIHETCSWIEGWLMEGQPKVVEFFVCTLKDILDAHKK